MVGNAAEEGLLGQVGNPSHGDPLRVVALAAFVSGGLAYLVARWLLPALTVWGGIVIGGLTSLAVAWGLASWLRRRSETRLAEDMVARRAAQMAETEAQIAQMRREPTLKREGA